MGQHHRTRETSSVASTASADTETGNKMGRYCVMFGCNTNSSAKSGISTHGFPTETHLRRSWVSFVKLSRKNFNGPKKNDVICGLHFKTSDFEDEYTAPLFERELGFRPKRRLKKDAIPTLITDKCAAALKKKDAADKTLETVTRINTDRKARIRKREIRKSMVDMKRAKMDAQEQSQQGMMEEPADSDVHWEDVPDTDDAEHGSVGCMSSTVDQAAASQQQSTDVMHRSVSANMTPYKRSKGIWVKPNVVDTAVQTESSFSCYCQCSLHHEPPLASSSPVHNQLDCTSSPVHDVDDDDTIEYGFESDIGSDLEFDPQSESHATEDSVRMTEEPSDDSSTNPAQSVPAFEERKYLVFQSSLLELFQLCSCCCSPVKPDLEELGTLLTVTAKCDSCQYVRQWRSQPLIGEMPVGNLLLSSSILFSGSLLTNTFRLLDCLNMARMSDKTFYSHQQKYLQPTVINVWLEEQAKVIDSLKEVGGMLELTGDGRSDSPGHCAKYGGFNTIECRINKVIDVQVVQSNEVGNSARCENEGLQRTFLFLHDAGLEVGSIVTDRHKQNEKYIREQKPNVKHYFDVWHVAKSLTKKLNQLANRAGMEKVGNWRKSIVNHLHWVAASTEDGNGEVMKAKWESLSFHLVNNHNGDSGDIPPCQHGQLCGDERTKDWFTPDSEDYLALLNVIENKYLLNDVKKLSPSHQTSQLEAFHSLVLSFCPKHTAFSWLGMYTRLFLAAMHYNENSERGYLQEEDGSQKMSIYFPKAKKGEYSIRRLKCDPTYGYVSKLFHHLFQKYGESPAALRSSLPEKFREKPDPLTAQHAYPSKHEAIRDDREVLLCRINTNNMIRKKNDAWAKIATDVSALGVALRTATGVRNKWRDVKKEVLGQKAAAAKTGGGPAPKPHPFTDLVNAILGEGSTLSSGIEVHGTDSSSTETCELQATVVSSNPVIPKVVTVGGGAVASSSVVVSTSLPIIHDVDCMTAGPDPCEMFLARSSPSRPATATATLSQEDGMVVDLEGASSVSTPASGARKAGIDMTSTTQRMKRRSEAAEKKKKYDAGLEQLSESQVETDKYRIEYYKSGTALNNLRIERETALTNLQIEREQLEILKLKRELGLE